MTENQEIFIILLMKKMYQHITQKTIENKLERVEYKDKISFEKELRIIFENAKEFNGSNIISCMKLFFNKEIYIRKTIIMLDNWFNHRYIDDQLKLILGNIGNHKKEY